MTALEAERAALAAAFGHAVPTLAESLHRASGVPRGPLPAMGAAIAAAGRSVAGPTSMETRCVTEDVPFSAKPRRWKAASPLSSSSRSTLRPSSAEGTPWIMRCCSSICSVGEQLVEAILLHQPLGRAARRQRVIALLGLVGIPDPAGRVGAHPHQVSSGMRRRVMIAMAPACNPKLLIADEPTTALDVTIQVQQVLDLIGGLAHAGELAALGDGSPSAELLRQPDPDATRWRIVLEGDVPSPARVPPGCRFHTRCLLAQAVCRTERPPLREVAEGQSSACHFAAPNPIPVPLA